MSEDAWLISAKKAALARVIVSVYDTIIEFGSDEESYIDGMEYRYVYLLRCADGKIYTGNTGNLQNRIKRHSEGYNSFTRSRLPVVLISYFAFSDSQTAYNFERYLKSGSGKAFAFKRLV